MNGDRCGLKCVQDGDAWQERGSGRLRDERRDVINRRLVDIRFLGRRKKRSGGPFFNGERRDCDQSMRACCNASSSGVGRTTMARTNRSGRRESVIFANDVQLGNGFARDHHLEAAAGVDLLQDFRSGRPPQQRRCAGPDAHRPRAEEGGLRKFPRCAWRSRLRAGPSAQMYTSPRTRSSVPAPVMTWPPYECPTRIAGLLNRGSGSS